jgi:hypothetical protein
MRPVYIEASQVQSGSGGFRRWRPHGRDSYCILPNIGNGSLTIQILSYSSYHIVTNEVIYSY